MYKVILLVSFFCFNKVFLYAQIQVTTSNQAYALAQKIVGQGVTILNPSFIGSSVCAGFFVDNKKTTGIDSGIILTNGRAKTLNTNYGINSASNYLATNVFPAGSSGINGYSSLSALLSSSSTIAKDACVLEFDFIPTGDSINVRFVFGSDEYPDYVCDDYNDIFAFFISGPGIVGEKNIATIPGTNTPITINTINNLSNCNGNPTYPQYFIDNTTNPFFSYNGFTKVFVAKAAVLPCQTYHIKLAIEDIGDAIYDSGVFLEASSFVSSGASLIATDGFIDAQNNISLIEGCRGGELKIKLETPATTSTNFFLEYSGSATYNVDYNPLPTNITFNVGEQEKKFYITPVLDNIIEPLETLIVNLKNGNCGSNYTVSSKTFYLRDTIVFTHYKDTFACSQFPTTLIAPKVDTAANKYIWSNGDTTRVINVNQPNIYWVKHYFANGCINLDSFVVANGDPTVALNFQSISFCNKDSVLISSTVNPTGGTYWWTNNSSQSSIYISTSGIHQLKYTSPNGCYSIAKVDGIVKPLPYPNLPINTAICSYDSLLLNAFYPNATYVWNTGDTSSSIVAKDSALYFVTNTLNNCVASDSIFIGRKKGAIAYAGLDKEIAIGSQTLLQALQTTNNASYTWKPTVYLDFPNSYYTNAFPPITTNFILHVTSTDGCVALDTVVITVKNIDLKIPNTFSPNGDGKNDYWEINGLTSFSSCKVEIFDRNGQIIFSSKGYQKPWDGLVNGKNLPIGTYYFIIQLGVDNLIKTGWIALVR